MSSPKLQFLPELPRKMSSSEANMAKLHAHIGAPLDDKLYRLDAEEVAFYKGKTGIQDDLALREHIIKVQQDAYQVSLVVHVGLCAEVDHGTLSRSSRICASVGSPLPSELSSWD